MVGVVVVSVAEVVRAVVVRFGERVGLVVLRLEAALVDGRSCVVLEVRRSARGVVALAALYRRHVSTDVPESGAESLGRRLARHRKWIIAGIVLVVGVVAYRSMGEDSGSGSKGGRWSGSVYPEGVSAPASTWINGGPFLSLDQCRAWVRQELQRKYPQGVPAHADYECGLNCKPRPSGLNVCEETRR